MDPSHFHVGLGGWKQRLSHQSKPLPVEYFVDTATLANLSPTEGLVVALGRGSLPHLEITKSQQLSHNAYQVHHLQSGLMHKLSFPKL